jgi:endoribonuclease Dicer
MAMVSNKFLGALAVKLMLHPHLQHSSAPLLSQNTRYAEALQVAESESNGEMDYWLSAPDSPKVVYTTFGECIICRANKVNFSGSP